MRSLIKSAIALVGVASIALGSAIAADAVNDKCPISGKAADGSKSVEFVAKFCCNKCCAKFAKDPTAYAAQAAKTEDGKCVISGKPISKAQYKVNIAVCCGKCKKKGAADPKALFAKLQKKKKD